MLQTSIVGVAEQKGNLSDVKDIFVRRPIFGMSPGLTNTAIVLPPSTAEG
jgi:hypothetical protein